MMQQREKLENLGNRILDTVRTQLLLELRFMAPAIGSLGFKMDLATRTVGTDAVYIRFNPDYLFRTYLEEPNRLTRAYMHILLHCLYGHMFTSADRKFDQSALWDLSADIAVEAVLDSMDYPCLRRVSSDFRDTVYAYLKEKVGVLTAERIYQFFRTSDILKKAESIGGAQAPVSGSAQDADAPGAILLRFPDLQRKLEKEFWADDHQFWDRLPEEKEPPKRKPDLPKEQFPDIAVRHGDPEKEKNWERVAKKVHAELQVLAGDKKDDAGLLVRTLDLRIRTETDYRDWLRRFSVVREEQRIDPDTFDYGLYYYGMEFYGNMPLIEENEFREARRVDELAIAIDTSGSTQARLVQIFLNETAALLASRDTFFHTVQIHIIECDDEVRRDVLIKDVEDMKRYAAGFQVKGGGGTDFRPVFAYVDELRHAGKLTKLRGLMYYTDGYGKYPEKPTDYETAFVLPRKGDVDDSHVPGWAVKLYI